MPSTDDIVRLRHMLDAARQAVKFAEGRTRDELDTNSMLALSIVRLLEIIGEAAKNVSEDFRRASTRIPWKQIAGTRDRLVHGYFDVDLDIVWAIVSSDLPALINSA
jgi:uncharacterized protein with HEPN domain